MICLTWWQFALLFGLATFCGKVGAGIYDLLKHARRRRAGKYFGL